MVTFGEQAQQPRPANRLQGAKKVKVCSPGVDGRGGRCRAGREANDRGGAAPAAATAQIDACARAPAASGARF